MSDILDALRQFDAAEANLKKLEDLWERIKRVIPSGMAIDTGSPEVQEYVDLSRRFEHIRAAMPRIGELELHNCLLEYSDIFQSRLDAAELGEVSVQVAVEENIYAQGKALAEYRFQFSVQRRRLVRGAMRDSIGQIDEVIGRLSGLDFEGSNESVAHPDWDSLKELVSRIDALRGSAVPRPERWGDLHRHLRFGLYGDLQDIVGYDWPAAKSSLEDSMYGKDDPLPVAVADLASLADEEPTGTVISELKWDRLTEDGYERLIFNIVSDADGYQNPQWLTRTKAPDKGRDISVMKVSRDELGGDRYSRVIVQCKHWTSKSISVGDTTALVGQMMLWEPPKVNELVIATSGRFSSDAVDWIEKHNNDDRSPRIQMWADSHLEKLLSARPHLIAEYGLR